LANQRVATTTMSNLARPSPEKPMLDFNNNNTMKLLNSTEIHFLRAMTPMSEINSRKLRE
jgi:hypothetical protein